MLLAPLLAFAPVDAQVPGADVPPPPPKAEQAWSAYLQTFYLDPPDGDGYLSGILAADKGQLHVEARWAYEDRDTASFFGGWTIPFEGDVHGSVRPMLGFAFGDSDGVIPAVSLDVGWNKLRFTSDAEYLIATSSDTQDFIYSWNELTWAFSDRFAVGLVAERTNVFDQALTIDRGLLLSAGVGPTRVTIYWFNPDLDNPYVSIAVGASF